MMKKVLYFFTAALLIVTISGCIPAALVIGATAGGSVVYDKRDFKTIAKDHNAQIALLDALSTDPDLKSQTHISVSVFNRVVLLLGQAPTQDLKDKAYQIASSVKGIDRVYNEITIENPISISQRSKDTWITTKIRTHMLTTKNLESTQIKVVTENGVVYLMGLVTQSQGSLAADVAQQVSGVQKIVKVFQYTV